MKPSILFIMHMPPPVHGAAMMGKYIHDSKLVNETFDCHYINLTTATSLQDIGKGGIGKLWKFVKLLCLIVKTLLAVKPQLVYVTPNACGGAFYKDFVVVQLIKTMGYKVVVHYHNKGVATRQDRWLDDKLYRRFFKGIKVILLAEVLYADVEKYVKREDVFICPNGIPETLTAEPSAERHNPVPRLLFLSNLLESKGVIVLLDALKILKDKGYSFICDFVGGETAEIDATRFEREVEQRGLNTVAIYNGKKYGDEKKEYFEKADAFVLPSFNEAFPLVNIEAMEFKLPVIATNVGGVAAEVKNGENGLICETRKPKSLADCIERLFGDEKLRQAMGEDGYKKFKEQFTVQAFEKNITSCLTDASKVLGGGKVSIAVWHGRKYGEEKEAYWRMADLFVFPTYYPNECFPLVLLEAMQHGVPCISTREGGITAIIDESKTGALVEKNDAAALAEQIAYCLDHPSEMSAMGKNGYGKYQQEFTLPQFERRMANILGAIA